MSRLTARNENGFAYLVNVKQNEQEVDSPHKNTLKCILDCFEQLAQYEDAEESGLLVRLPCKVGDTVWAYDDVFNQIAPHQIDMVELYGHTGVSFCSNWSKSGELMADLDFDVDEIGKTVFLTREEAEAALAKEGR